jgi:hypothetical protein
MSQERKDAIKQAIIDRAKSFGIAIEHAAADEIADLRTDAADSILRAAIVCSALGLIIGMVIGYTL